MKWSYRPVFDTDTTRVASYHSTESSLLVTLLKWIDQEQIPTEYLTIAGLPTLLQKLNVDTSSWTKFADFGDRDDPRTALISFLFPILSESKKSTAQGCHSLPCGTTEHSYGIYVGSDKSLVFIENWAARKEVLRVLPLDADAFAKALFSQTAARQGRTSTQGLTEIVHYRFSEEFARDQRKYANTSESS